MVMAGSVVFKSNDDKGGTRKGGIAKVSNVGGIKVLDFCQA